MPPPGPGRVPCWLYCSAPRRGDPNSAGEPGSAAGWECSTAAGDLLPACDEAGGTKAWGGWGLAVLGGEDSGARGPRG